MLVETIEALIKLALERGYSKDDIEMIKRAYVIAAEFSKNRVRYRKKTRKFISHLVSTCSMLIYSNLNIETVVAGLLHSVKNNMPLIYGLNAKVGEIVDAYYDSSTENRERKDFSAIEWAVISIQQANSTDMILSGECNSHSELCKKLIC
jgi:(p)ppGpp synthase/HD superfamily hydrolase